MSSVCIYEGLAQNTPQIFLYIVLKLSFLEGEQKHTVFVCVPLNANELLLWGQGAELQQLSFYLKHALKMSKTFSLLCLNSYLRLFLCTQIFSVKYCSQICLNLC